MLVVCSFMYFGDLITQLFYFPSRRVIAALTSNQRQGVPGEHEKTKRFFRCVRETTARSRGEVPVSAAIGIIINRFTSS